MSLKNAARKSSRGGVAPMWIRVKVEERQNK